MFFVCVAIVSLQIPEYCRALEEKEIQEQAFNLIFAFDEIVALGYRESVNLAQIKTFVEMDSHEEKVYLAVRQTQEREAKQKMREKAKELQRQRLEISKRGISIGGRSYGNSSGNSSEGFGSTGGISSSSIEERGREDKHSTTRTSRSCSGCLPAKTNCANREVRPILPLT